MNDSRFQFVSILGLQTLLVVAGVIAFGDVVRGQNKSTAAKTEQSVSQSNSRPRIELALNYLFQKQQSDGSWKSEYYGNLKQGAATTSLVLFSLSHCDPNLLRKRHGDIGHAFRFLKKGIAKHGFVANVSGPDYANYATALTLLAESNFKKHLDTEFFSETERKKLVQFLIDSQLDETHGMKPDRMDYGGWDLSGWMQQPRPSAGTNISVSSFVLLALQSESCPAAKAARDKAAAWIKRVQNIDKGFHFHPKKDHSGNKAEWIDGNPQRPKSYGTATVDGIRALRCLGDKNQSNDKSISGAAAWINENVGSTHPLKYVPGFEPKEAGQEGSWGQGLLYYFWMSLALEQDSLPESLREKCRNTIPSLIISAQQKDGRWENNSARMREDDPLIATSFALIALSKLVPTE